MPRRYHGGYAVARCPRRFFSLNNHLRDVLTTDEVGSGRVLRWALFFALAYLVQGFAQTTGVLYQPLQFYLKDGHGYGAGQLASFTFWVTFPWYIKPVYGLFADFIPLLGYRRRSYLIASCLLSFGAFTLVLGVREPTILLYTLVLTAVCTAVGDVMVDALMVEKGQAYKKIKLFQGLQWTTISVIGILAAIGGGQLAQHAKETGEPFAGVRIAALIAMVGPAILLVSTIFIVREKRSRLDAEGLRNASRGFRLALTSRPLLGVILFVSLFWFQPGLITPMYIHCTQTLDISEAFYGGAGAWAQGGYAIGALLFLLVLGPRFSVRQLAALSIVIYAASTFAYLALAGETTLIVLSVFYGVTYMIANLTLLSLAAQVCPRHVEAFVFAFLMGLFNFVKQGSEWIGGRLFDNLRPAIEGGDTNSPWAVFDLSGIGLTHAIDPLIIISGLITLLAFAFIPLLPKRNDPVGDPRSDTTGLCPSCLYDLRGNVSAARCPECGNVLALHSAEDPQPDLA